MDTDHTQMKPELAKYWPRVEPSLPSPWGLPLTMMATGNLVAVEILDKAVQVFKYQNWSGQVHIPVHVPQWLTENFPEILDRLHGDTLSLDISRFHGGGALVLDQWEDQWFTVICQPHFNYIPCALTGDEEVAYKRLAWIKDNGIMP
jgi:hypothetical protein